MSLRSHRAPGEDTLWLREAFAEQRGPDDADPVSASAYRRERNAWLREAGIDPNEVMESVTPISAWPDERHFREIVADDGMPKRRRSRGRRALERERKLRERSVK